MAERNIVHTDVTIEFEKAKRMLFGLPTACENCGVKDDGVDGYEYPKSGKRLLLCRSCAEKEHFCFGCHRRYREIAVHIGSCSDVENAIAEDRHEAALDWVENRADQLRAGHNSGHQPLATAVLRAYQTYVKDDLYEDEDLAHLEAAIQAYEAAQS